CPYRESFPSTAFGFRKGVAHAGGLVRLHSCGHEFLHPHFDVEPEFVIELFFQLALAKRAKQAIDPRHGCPLKRTAGLFRQLVLAAPSFLLLWRVAFGPEQSPGSTSPGDCYRTCPTRS